MDLKMYNNYKKEILFGNMFTILDSLPESSDDFHVFELKSAIHIFNGNFQYLHELLQIWESKKFQIHEKCFYYLIQLNLFNSLLNTQKKGEIYYLINKNFEEYPEELKNYKFLQGFANILYSDIKNLNRNLKIRESFLKIRNNSILFTLFQFIANIEILENLYLRDEKLYNLKLKEFLTLFNDSKSFKYNIFYNKLKIELNFQRQGKKKLLDSLNDVLEFEQQQPALNTYLANVNRSRGEIKICRSLIERGIQEVNINPRRYDSFVRADLYRLLGLLNEIQGNLSESITAYYKCLSYFGKIPYSLWFSYIIGNIARVNIELGNYHESFESLKENLKHSEFDNSQFFYNLILIANVFKKLNITIRDHELFKNIDKDVIDPNFNAPYFIEIEALIAEQEHNYGIAVEKWLNLISRKSKESIVRIFSSYESLAKIYFQLWIINKSQVSEEKLMNTLSEWENTAKEMSALSWICKVKILQSKIELSKVNFDVALTHINECIDLAHKQDLIFHKKLALEEKNKILERKGMMINAIKNQKSEKAYESEQLDEFEDYLNDLNLILNRDYK